MTAPYTDSTQIIDGAGEIFELDTAPATLAAHHTTACTATVLTMVSDPRDVFRVGDVIYDNAAATDYQRISAMDATTITVEGAGFSVAPAVDASIRRKWRLMGATQGGISVETQTTVQERNVDQVLDPVAIKGDKRTASVKAGLVEMVGDNLKVALALAASQVSVAGAATTVNVGSSSTNLNTNSFLIIGLRNDGSYVTCKLQKAVNTGNVALKFDKAGNAVLQLDLRLMNDSSKTSGQELFRIKTDTTYDWAL